MRFAFLSRFDSGSVTSCLIDARIATLECGSTLTGVAEWWQWGKMTDDNMWQRCTRRRDDIVQEFQCDKRGWSYWQGNLANMTGKSSSNKVPSSTLYYFIASGFWSCKCSGIEEDLSAVSPALSGRDLFHFEIFSIQITSPGWPAEVSANIQSGMKIEEISQWKQIFQR